MRKAWLETKENIAANSLKIGLIFLDKHLDLAYNYFCVSGPTKKKLNAITEEQRMQIIEVTAK